MTRRPLATALAACWLFAAAAPATPTPAPSDPPADARAKAEAAVVLIETYDAQGRPAGYVSGFLAHPNWVITNWHCVEGASDAFVNLGERGLVRVTGILADDPEHDFVILTADLPADAGPPLNLAGDRTEPGAPVWIAVRDRFGALTLSGGAALEESGPYGVTQFESDARGWPGCSGSPWIDGAGRAVAVVKGGGRKRDDGSGERISIGIPARTVAKARLREPRALRDWWGIQLERRMPEVRACHHRAREAFADDDYGKAAAEYKRGLAIMPEYLVLRHYLASALELAGKPDDAVAALREYTDRFPATAGIMRHIGDIRYRMGRYADARKAYTEAVAIEPIADHYFWLGAAEDHLESADAARAAYEKALELEPGHRRARTALLCVLATAGEADRVVPALAEMAAGTEPDYDAIVTIAGYAARAGHAGLATSAADAIAPRNPYVANRIRSMIELAATGQSPVPDVTPPAP